tara:strand:- start:117 stop:290 length:174 start_codon:yes stop_codon:yes gene_type:complete
MNITSAKYIKNIITNVNDNIKAIINDKEMSVPLDPDNRHYQAIQEWVAKGNKIEDAD